MLWQALLDQETVVRCNNDSLWRIGELITGSQLSSRIRVLALKDIVQIQRQAVQMIGFVWPKATSGREVKLSEAYAR